LEQFYSSADGYLPSVEHILRKYEENPEASQYMAQSILDYFRPYTKDIQGRILDIGCAYGLSLLEWKNLGLECYGVEVSTETTQFVKDKGVKIHIGTLHSASYSDNFLDFITMSHVLEHDPAPLKLMSEIRRVMAKDGLLWLAVPNWGSLARKVDGKRWKWRNWPNHLFYYTPDTLSRLVKSSGFEIIKLWTDEYQADPIDINRVISKVYRNERRNFSSEKDFEANLTELVFRNNMGQSLHAIAKRNDHDDSPFSQV